MRSPTNLVLLAMAVCDLLTITIPAPWSVDVTEYINIQIGIRPLPSYFLGDKIRLCSVAMLFLSNNVQMENPTTNSLFYCRINLSKIF